MKNSDPIFLLVDTGSAVSLISDKVLHPDADITPIRIRVEAVTQDPIPITGQCNLHLFKNNRLVGDVKFLVTTQAMDHFDGILGDDWLKKVKAQVDYGSEAVLTDSVSIPFQRSATVSATICGLMVRPHIYQRTLVWTDDSLICSEDLRGSDGTLRCKGEPPRIYFQRSKSEMPLELAAQVCARLWRCLKSCVDEHAAKIPCQLIGSKGSSPCDLGRMPQQQLTDCGGSSPLGCPDAQEVREHEGSVLARGRMTGVESDQFCIPPHGGSSPREKGSSPCKIDKSCRNGFESRSESCDGFESHSGQDDHNTAGHNAVGHQGETITPLSKDCSCSRFESCSRHRNRFESCVPPNNGFESHSRQKNDQNAVKNNSPSLKAQCGSECTHEVCKDPACRCLCCRKAGKRIRMILYAKRNEELPANCTANIEVIYARKKHGKPNNCLLDTRSALQPNRKPYLVGSAVLHFSKVMAVPYVNLTDHNISIRRGDVIAFAEECYPDEIIPETDEDIPEDETDVAQGEEAEVATCNFMEILKSPETNKRSTAEEDAKVKQMITQVLKNTECPEHLLPQLRAMLWKHKRVLADRADPVGLISGYQPTIDLDTDKPIYVPQYPIPFKMRKLMKETIAEFLKNGIIVPSKSPYNAPSIIVAKKDIGVRMCIDYRVLNEHVLTDRHPLPRINQILEELGGAMYLTALDLLHGFYNLEINPADRWKTAFSTPDGHYEFLRLPMGLKNSPSIFQRTMNMVLQDVLGRFCFIYLDDLVIYSKTAEDHIKHLDAVLEKLHQHGLRIKFTKSQLFRTQIHYLGFIVSRDGLRVNPEKVRAATEFPRPKNVKGIQAFLGLVGYFRTFIENFAGIARPLYNLLKQDVSFSWGEEQEEAFQQLKQALAEAPVLAFPDFTKEFIITTDASADAIGAVMTQIDDDGKERLISCHSRTLRGAEKNYDNYDRETLAVFYGAEQNHSYIWGGKVRFRTDNSAVVHLGKDKRSHSARSLRWYIKLGEYDYTIEHKSGKKIAHADALSRYPVPDSNEVPKVDNISRPVPDACNIVSATMFPDDTHDDQDMNLIAYLSPSLKAMDLVPVLPEQRWRTETEQVPPSQLPQGDLVEVRDGIVYIKVDNDEKVWVPPSLRRDVIKLYHDPPNAGHRGTNTTSQHLKRDVVWSSLDNDVKHYIKHCVACQKAKNYGKVTPPYKVTPIPKRCFEEVSLDVVGPMAGSYFGTKYILAIQDRLSRWVVFAPMRDTSAETTSRTFLQKWVMVYGPPRKLITDRGTNFVSTYFTQLAAFLGIEPTTTVAYRPQANGQNERSHRELTMFLKLYLSETDKGHWDTMLAMASWVHNSSYHRALKMSPYEVLTGMKPNQARMWLPGESEKITEEEIHQHFGVRKERLEQIRKLAIEAIQRMQNDYLQIQSRRPIPHIFKVGQKVLLKKHTASKFAQSYFGPFIITKVISESAIEIEEPDTGKRDTVHTQYVKPYYDLAENEENVARFKEQFPVIDSEDTEKDVVISPQYHADDPEHEVILEQEPRVNVPAPPPDNEQIVTRQSQQPEEAITRTPKKGDESEKQQSLGNKFFSAARRLFGRDEKQAAEAIKTPAIIPDPKPAVQTTPAVPKTIYRRAPTHQRGVQFSTDIQAETTKTADSAAPSTSKPPTSAKKRRNADEIMLADDWLSRQKPSISPPVTDRPLETRSAKKKRKIKVRRVPFAPSETTPIRVRRTQNQKAMIRKPVKAQETLVTKKPMSVKRQTRADHEPSTDTDNEDWTDAPDI